MRRRNAGLRWACLLWTCLLFAAAISSAAEVDYTRDVRPLLKQHCYNCHSSLRQKGGLRLDHASFLRSGGDSGAAIAATGADSLLIKVLRGTADVERMPLEADPLSEEQIGILSAWIDAGAPAPEEKVPDDPRNHWSFQKPVRAALPNVQNAAWSSHPIDRFLAAEHERRGVAPVGPAAKNVLLRRVYLDLIGLPPTKAELDEFLADNSEGAYERVIDRLLASPHYGERWGRHWMDVWRYSDWDGFGAEVRESQPHIWRWRDWIIESINADRPYDQMIMEMLAADEIAPDDPQTLRASGFLVRNWYKFNRNVWLEGTVEHTSKAFLGITLNCARCHDHMYDPILQTEYYQFRAFFEPHNVRTDRVPKQSDTRLDGVVRVFDAEAAAPTYLFDRGNEAKPDKEHPLPPAVPRSLGGDTLKIDPVALAATSYYPGLRAFVQQEAIDQAQADLNRTEKELAARRATLAEARKKLDEFEKSQPAPAAAPATATAAETPPAAAPATEKAPTSGEALSALTAAVNDGKQAAALAEQEFLAASVGWISVKARIAADKAAFAVPPAAEAKELAREAGRAERVFNVEQGRFNTLRLERELAAAKLGTDDAAKKKAKELETKLAEAHKTAETAQAALGQSTDSYSHFGQVYPTASTGRRTALARWIASKNNPLTARVAVNHIWLRHFGSPLVPNVFDFGLNGKPPTHPALLDWLAVELMDGGWRTKAIHRLIVTSAAYRMQSSGTSQTNVVHDPENLLLWRMNPRRMEAEVVRDSTLRVADSLDGTMFGPDLDQNTGLTVPRRSIYFRNSKEKKVTFLEMFDSPNVTDCYRRSETVVPQQALAMVNSSLTLAQARRLASNLTKELNTQSTPEGLAAFVAAAFERILCRAPSEPERTACLEFLDSQSKRFADPKLLVAFTSGGENPIKPSDDPAARARENLIHVLLNHTDFLTVR